MEFEEWARIKREEWAKIHGNEVSNQENAITLITRKTITFETDGFEFTIHAVILPSIKRKFSAFKSKMDTDSIKSYDEIQDLLAEIMAELCIDKNMDKQFWKSFDESTGLLEQACSAVMEALQNVDTSVNSFRVKQ